jgi:hypothetical protein
LTALTFEFDAIITFELLRPPVETFIAPLLPFVLLLAEDDDVEVDGDEPEIVTFKNGFKNCQKNASAPFDCVEMKKSNFILFLRLFHVFSSFDNNIFNRYRVVAL